MIHTNDSENNIECKILDDELYTHNNTNIPQQNEFETVPAVVAPEM